MTQKLRAHLKELIENIIGNCTFRVIAKVPEDAARLIQVRFRYKDSVKESSQSRNAAEAALEFIGRRFPENDDGIVFNIGGKSGCHVGVRLTPGAHRGKIAQIRDE